MNSWKAGRPRPRSPALKVSLSRCAKYRLAKRHGKRRAWRSTRKVWELIGQFGGIWHPLIAKIKLTGTGIGQLRMIETIDGKQIIERLDALDNSARSYRYTNIGGIPASDYTGVLEVKPKGVGSSVEWRSQFLPNGPGTLIMKTIVATLFKTGLESLKARF